MNLWWFMFFIPSFIQSALCVPMEDGIDVYSSTQSLKSIQTAVTQTLGVSANTYVHTTPCGFYSVVHADGRLQDILL